jgi:hypothetical protein
MMNSYSSLVSRSQIGNLLAIYLWSDICVAFGDERKDFPGSDAFALPNALDYAKQCLGGVI